MLCKYVSQRKKNIGQYTGHTYTSYVYHHDIVWTPYPKSKLHVLANLYKMYETKMKTIKSYILEKVN